MPFRTDGYFVVYVTNAATLHTREIFLPITKTASDVTQYMPRMLFAAIQDSGLDIERVFLHNGARIVANVSSIHLLRPTSELQEPVMVHARSSVPVTGKAFLHVTHAYYPAFDASVNVYGETYALDELRATIAAQWSIPWQWVKSAIGAATAVDFMVYGVSAAALQSERNVHVTLHEPYETLLRTQSVEATLSAHPLQNPKKHALFASPLPVMDNITGVRLRQATPYPF